MAENNKINKPNPIRDIVHSWENLAPGEKIRGIDWQRAGVKKIWIMVIIGRVGSTALVEPLAQTKALGHANEYFSEEYYMSKFASGAGTASLQDYVEKIAKDFSQEGVFGFKINPTRLFWLGEVLEICKAFPSPMTSWIDCRRRNIIAQALSFAKARHSGRWHSAGNETVEERSAFASLTPAEKSARIWQEIFSILQQEHNIDEFYDEKKIVPMKICYEDIVSNLSLVANKIFHYVHGEVPAPDTLFTPKTSKLANDNDLIEEIQFFRLFARDLQYIEHNRARIDIPELRKRVNKRLREIPAR